MKVTITSLDKSHTKLRIVRDSLARPFRKIKGLEAYKKKGTIMYKGFQPMLTPLMIGRLMASMIPNSNPKKSVCQLNIVLL
jgi:hypothetical protein